MPQVYVFGPFNSGTNLMYNAINHCQCINTLTSTPVTNSNSSIWKHTIKMSDFKNLIKNKNNIIIFMYKNVYNWIASIQKAPYDIKFKNIDKKEKLNNNIILNNTEHNYNHTFGNIIHLYNFYYFTYMSLLNKHHDNVIFIDYHKVINKNTSYKYINHKLNKINLALFDEQAYNNLLDKPCKKHGSSVKNSEEAYAKYLNTNKTIKQYLINKTNIHKYVNNDIMKYFEDDSDNTTMLLNEPINESEIAALLNETN